MQGVTIDVFPQYATLSDGFRAALQHAYDQRQPSLTYKGATFRVSYGIDKISEVKVVLTDINAPLPAIFQGELTVNFVVLRCPVPAKLKAPTGWYVGDNFGFPGANCCIDPQGEGNEGRPLIYANGDNFASVVGLFRKVMSGQLTPGNDGDKWGGTIRRH